MTTITLTPITSEPTSAAGDHGAANAWHLTIDGDDTTLLDPRGRQRFAGRLSALKHRLHLSADGSQATMTTIDTTLAFSVPTAAAAALTTALTSSDHTVATNATSGQTDTTACQGCLLGEIGATCGLILLVLGLFLMLASWGGVYQPVGVALLVTALGMIASSAKQLGQSR